MGKIRVLVAHRDWLFREGLKLILKNEPGLSCIGIASDGKEAIQLAQELLPDVVLIGVELPEIDGIEAAKQIKESCSQTSVLVVSDYKDRYYVRACIDAGANGYLSRNNSREELLSIIRLVNSGHNVFEQDHYKKILQNITRGLPLSSMENTGPLHNRELEVLGLGARGMANKEIARQLNISEHTVRTHFINIFRKLGVTSRLEATLYALKQNWFNIDDL